MGDRFGIQGHAAREGKQRQGALNENGRIAANIRFDPAANYERRLVLESPAPLEEEQSGESQRQQEHTGRLRGPH